MEFKRFCHPDETEEEEYEKLPKEIRKDIELANDILQQIEDYPEMYFPSQLPEWLKELEQDWGERPTKRGLLREEKSKKEAQEHLETLQRLVVKLKFVGIDINDNYNSDFNHITNALKKAYPPKAFASMFQNNSPFLNAIRKSSTKSKP